MRILALETSTEFCSVALWQDGDVRAKSELVGQKHSELLLNPLKCGHLPTFPFRGLELQHLKIRLHVTR